MSLSNQLLSIINQINKYLPSNLVIGYSGGIDSSVILDICKNIHIPIVAIHINHNINLNANKWYNHCQKFCKENNIPFDHYTLGKAPKGESFEAYASKQRMIFFKKNMLQYNNPLLILGHNLDDQAETFLLQAIRGSGLAGLSAMPKYKKLSHGAIFRPLLDISRLHIQNYAQENNIVYIYDESNSNPKYKRNFIRHNVLSSLRQINPNISKTLSRSASICAKSNKILDIFIRNKIDNIICDNKILASKLISIEIEIQEAILHFWFKKETNISLKANQLNSIIKSLNHKASTGWETKIDNYILKLEYDQISINNTIITVKPINHNKKTIINWLRERNVNKDISNIIIREKKSNDRCQYVGRHKKNKLKILFQELKIPESQRLKAKVIEKDHQIIAVYPFFLCV